MKDALFKAYHEDGNDISKVDILTSLAEGAGLPGEDFKRKLESQSTRSIIEENIRLSRTYKLTGTPTFILDGNIKVRDYSFENMKAVIDSLLQES